jgi:succinate dehydrogenase / fumarate reductase cytochrome b subunit
MASRPLASSIGTKLLVGITGLFLFFYLLIHIAGNLVVFAGPDTFNKYAGALSGNPLVLVIEAVLLVAFLIHVLKTVTMTLANRRARPVAYVVKKPAGGRSRKTLASSTMIVSGIWLLIFVVLHVRAYRLEMDNFANPLVVVFYVLSMLVVGSHLSHGISSAFQSLGLDHPAWTPRILVGGKIAAGLITMGFIVIALWAHFNGGMGA